MPFVVTVVLLAIAVSYVRGGRMRNIAAAPLHHGWLLALGVVLQVGVDLAAARGWLTPDVWWTYGLLATSQLFVVAWVVVNRHLPGLVLVAAGLAANALVMAANGAMPVSPEAIAALGIGDVEVPPGKHILLDASTRLPWLADVIPVPPLRSIISVGDILLAIGLIPLTHRLMTWPMPTDVTADQPDPH
ncbi:MAG: DUF5317 domain-containing protein [Actinobacteria bacterium]|jgi:hypothetical protein|nr:DUF5317 domain-containing protein [Actinomycetota bacterium]